MHNYFTMKSTSNYAVLLNFETKKRWNTQIYEYYLNHSTQKWVDNGHNGCLYLSGRVCYLEWDYWRESSDYDRNMSVACAYSQTDTSTCKNTKLFTYFFILCRKKTHTENVPRKTRNLSEDLLFLIHALFKRDFYIVSYSPEHNTTERTKPDFVYICKSNHTSHLLAHAQKKGDVWTNVNLSEPWARSVDTTYYKRQQLPLK